MDLLSIKNVSTLTDLPASTLRFWEKVFPEFINPTRTEGGQRRYSHQNISNIQRIRKLREEGFSIKHIQIQISNNQLAHSAESDRADVLAESIANVVKTEVSNYFQAEGEVR